MKTRFKSGQAVLAKLAIAAAVFCWAGVYSARADTIMTGSFTGDTGVCLSGTGTLDISSPDGGINFLGNSYCYLGGSSSYDPTSFATFGGFSYFGTTYTNTMTAADLLALTPGTYYETGTECDALDSCNPDGTGFSVVITSSTITLSNVIDGASITVALENTSGTPVGTPEPGTLLLLGLGLAGLAGMGIHKMAAA